jgi:hypothetical protein
MFGDVRGGRSDFPMLGNYVRGLFAADEPRDLRAQRAIGTTNGADRPDFPWVR